MIALSKSLSPTGEPEEGDLGGDAEKAVKRADDKDEGDNYIKSMHSSKATERTGTGVQLSSDVELLQEEKPTNGLEQTHYV